MQQRRVNNWVVLAGSLVIFLCIPLTILAIVFVPKLWEQQGKGKPQPTQTSALATFMATPTALPSATVTPLPTSAGLVNSFGSVPPLSIPVTATPIPTQKAPGTYCQFDGNSRLACRPYGASIIGVTILADGFERINAANTAYWQSNMGLIPKFSQSTIDGMLSWTAPDINNTRCWLWQLVTPIPQNVGVMIYSSLGSETLLVANYDDNLWRPTPPQVSICSLSIDGSIVIPQFGDTLVGYIEGLGWEVTQDRIWEFSALNGDNVQIIAGESYVIPPLWVNPRVQQP